MPPTPYKYTENKGNTNFGLFGIEDHFLLKYGVPEVQEVSKNLPGAHGFVFPKYEPVAIHGNPIQASGKPKLSDIST